jgi:hypothetical protein
MTIFFRFLLVGIVILILNLFSVALIIFLYACINAFIEELTGTSLSEKIRNYSEKKRTR